jgi:NADH:ubiquinone oxidoreductase subunit C
MADDDTEAREEVHEGDDAAAPEPPVPSDDVAAALVAQFPDGVFTESHGQPVVYVPREQWHDVAAFLRDEQQFTQCVDIAAVDQLVAPERAIPPGVTAERFEVVANFLSHARNRRIRVIAQLPVDDPTIASITDLYRGVNFAERETYDLFGVEFTGHPDLTRILMPDDWVGHPLRKDDAPARVPVTFKGDPSPR